MDEHTHNPLTDLINSVGALAEMTVLYQDELLKRGVSQQDALRFTQTFIMASLSGNGKKE